MTRKMPLVLLPGLLCDAALWRPQVEALSDIAEIQVGDLTRHDTMAGRAADVLEQAPGCFALAGLSMGGYLAFEILRQAPERVSRLALLDTSARPDVEAQTQRRRTLMGLAEDGRFQDVTPQLLPMLVHSDRLTDTSLTATVTGMADRIGKDAFVRQQTAIIARPDSRPMLSDIRQPTLVLCGRQDALTPLEAHEEMAESIPDADLVVVEDCGHLAPLERPEPVNRALRSWLNGAPAQA